MAHNRVDKLRVEAARHNALAADWQAECDNLHADLEGLEQKTAEWTSKRVPLDAEIGQLVAAADKHNAKFKEHLAAHLKVGEEPNEGCALCCQSDAEAYKLKAEEVRLAREKDKLAAEYRILLVEGERLGTERNRLQTREDKHNAYAEKFNAEMSDLEDARDRAERDRIRSKGRKNAGMADRKRIRLELQRHNAQGQRSNTPGAIAYAKRKSVAKGKA